MNLPPRSLAFRIFLTCWLVYTLHFASNIVREIYPALSLGDHLSFRVDEYAHLHPDLFEKDGYGWHIGNNPGASMVAAIPYALLSPGIAYITDRVQRQRAASGAEAPVYESPWPMARKFHAEAWSRGLDVKFVLAAFTMQAFAMAPSSALGVVVIFYLLRRLLGSDRPALWLSLLYAFGTPVFFRTGFLNQNMMLGHAALIGFVAMWNPGGSRRWSPRARSFFGGLMGGTTVLFDYSGAVFLLGLFSYRIARSATSRSPRQTARDSLWFILGSLPPIFLLWFYQWRSFGHPFFPGQHWMPPVEWIELGYQGYGWPQLELLAALAFDHRFGLFVTCPVLLFALAYPFFRRRGSSPLPRTELVFLLATVAALWVFFSGSNYTRLQFNTGIRYMAPAIPFLFIPSALLMRRLHAGFFYLVALTSVTLGWCLAMVRDVESGLGMLNPLLQVFIGGFRLPALMTLSYLESEFGRFFPVGVSPLPLFALTAALIYFLWSPALFGRHRTARDHAPESNTVND